MIAVIHYAYGAPTSIDDLPSYFSHLLKGKVVPEPMLEGIRASFLKPGFPDFIASTTQRVAAGLEHYLNGKAQEEVRVFTAYKHTAPFVADAVAAAQQAGATTIVTLPINPIDTDTGGGAVHAEVAELLKGTDIKHRKLNNWHVDEGIIAVYAERVQRAFAWLPLAAQENGHVLFTVHSQPLDPMRNALYVMQFEQMAAAIAKKAGITHFHKVYRSANGAAGWLAPDVKDKIRGIQAAGAKGIVTCELLSLCADAESYAEIVTDCQKVCGEREIAYSVTEFPGDSYDTVVALGNLILKSI